VASKALPDVVARSVAPVLATITLVRFRVLMVLSSPGSSKMSDLAESILVQPSTFSRMVDRLVWDGWVLRRTNEESRREVLIRFTRGQDLVDAVADRRRMELRRILGDLKPAERNGCNCSMCWRDPPRC
jgi:DNA-binding MarR family transcriptional regulator